MAFLSVSSAFGGFKGLEDEAAETPRLLSSSAPTLFAIGGTPKIDRDRLS